MIIMRELSNAELKKVMLDALLVVNDFCRKNGIEYFLEGGTSIGAVRHKGYIPWDDDIDIAMTRPNYERFIHSFGGYCDHLSLFAPELDENYYASYANVCDNRTLLLEDMFDHRGYDIGVKIDIFPIDGCEDDLQVCKRWHILVRLLANVLSRRNRNMRYVWQHNKWNFLTCSIVRLSTGLIKFSTIMHWLLNIVKRCDYAKANYAYHASLPYKKVTRCPKQVWEEYIDMDFEGYKVRNLKDFDTHLRTIFGDYMQLPPESEQVAHHGFTAYWKD